MDDLGRVLRVLDARKRYLDAARPLPAETVRSLREALRVEHTYASNAIEGNTLTLQETRAVLEGFTVAGKPLRHHLEAIDHAEAFDYMVSLADQRQPVTEHVIRSIHALVLRRSRPDDAGRYRDVHQVLISGSRHIPPQAIEVPQRMEELVAWLREREEGDHPVRLAGEFHARFVAIHPFVDGNGRTARLLSNLLLMRRGYPPASWCPGGPAAVLRRAGGGLPGGALRADGLPHGGGGGAHVRPLRAGAAAAAGAGGGMRAVRPPMAACTATTGHEDGGRLQNGGDAPRLPLAPEARRRGMRTEWPGRPPTRRQRPLPVPADFLGLA